MVECQDERSQHKNRARAMSLLNSRLLSAEQEKHHAEQARPENCRSAAATVRNASAPIISAGPRNRSPHQFNAIQLDNVMQGQLDELLDALALESQAEALAEE